LKVLGPDDAWERLQGILEWEQDVWTEGGGYRPYYEEADRGTTLQGCNTPGGLGIDCEFFETSLLPAFTVYGFMGIDPSGDALVIDPRLPQATPRMTVRNVLHRWSRMDITAEGEGNQMRSIEIVLHDKPAIGINIELPGEWTCDRLSQTGSRFRLTDSGTYTFVR
jgi:hypothetical protein